MKDESSAKVIPGSSDINDVRSIIQNLWRVRDNGENTVVEERGIKSKEGSICHKCTDCPTVPFLSTVNSVASSTDDNNNFQLVSVMTQTELQNVQLKNVFPSSQLLEKETTVIHYSPNEHPIRQELVDNRNTKNNVLKAMISFENECEIRMKRQVQQACRIAIDATRAEEVIKHRKEIDALLLNLDAQQKMKIEEAVSVERARFKELSDDLEHEHALWRQEREKIVREMGSLKYKLDIDKTNLEERISKLALEEESFRSRVLEVESKRKDIERREIFLNETSAMESRKAQDEARKTYEVALEAVMLQREFYDAEIKALQSKLPCISQTIHFEDPLLIQGIVTLLPKKGEKKLLSVARSELADHERDTSRLVISLRNENDSLQTRLQAAETQLNEIGSFIGDKENIVSKCRNLLKYVKSYRNLKEKLNQSRVEITTLHKRVKEESRKLEESLSIAENEQLRLQGQNNQLILRIDVLENEINSSRRECADLGTLLQECREAFNSLGNPPFSRNDSIGWRSIYNNPCTSKLNLPSHDVLGTIELQYRPPSHKIYFKGMYENSAEGMLLQKLGHCNQKIYSVGENSTAPDEDPTSKICVVDTCMTIGPLTPGVPSNNSKIDSVNVTEKSSEDDTKKNPECKHFEIRHPKINVNSTPHIKSNQDTSPSEAVLLTDEEESMKVPKLKALLADELQPRKINTYQGSVDTTFIASDTYVQSQHEDDTILQLEEEATRQVVLPIVHSTEFISEPIRFLAQSIPSTGKIEGQTLNTCLSEEEERIRSPELENISMVYQENRSQPNGKMISHYSLNKIDSSALVDDEPQPPVRTLSFEKYELCEFEEETNGDATEGAMTQDEPQNTSPTQHNHSLSYEKYGLCEFEGESNGGDTKCTMTLDKPKNTSPTQENHSLSSENYELCEFEEETKGEATENIEETKAEGSVTYSMNWSKNDVENSTVISTEVEESQENGTVSLEIVSTYYESSVDDTDNNW